MTKPVVKDDEIAFYVVRFDGRRDRQEPRIFGVSGPELSLYSHIPTGIVAGWHCVNIAMNDGDSFVRCDTLLLAQSMVCEFIARQDASDQIEDEKHLIQHAPFLEWDDAKRELGEIKKKISTSYKKAMRDHAKRTADLKNRMDEINATLATQHKVQHTYGAKAFFAEKGIRPTTFDPINRHQSAASGRQSESNENHA